MGFRPLWGSFLFLLVRMHSIKQFNLRFRPLWGSFLFLSRRLLYLSRIAFIVSVPYGDLFISIMKMGTKANEDNTFPSPVGVFFISMKGKKVSVKCNVCFVSVPFGDLFCFYRVGETPAEYIPTPFPSPLGIFFISIEFTRDAMVLAYVFPSPTGFFFISIVKPENCYPCGTFPSPLGSFFISILSYGNLAEHRENLHFAVQKVFSGKIRGFEAFKVLSPPILCPAVQNYDSTSSIFPIP